MVPGVCPDAVSFYNASAAPLFPACVVACVTSRWCGVPGDLRAAAALGLRTAFVARPLEFGAGGVVDTRYEDEFDVNAADFVDLAEQLGC